MDVEGGKEPQAAVMMHGVVPLEEVDAERPGILDGAEPVGESRRAPRFWANLLAFDRSQDFV